MRFLVIRSGAVGDTVLCFPVLYALKSRARAGWKTHVTLAARSEARLLAHAGGLADDVVDFGSPHFLPLFSKWARAADSPPDSAEAELRTWLGRFDLIISLLADRDGRLAERLRWLGAREVRSFGTLTAAEPVSRQLFRVVEPLGLEYPDGRTLVELPPASRRRHGGPYAVVHVGSGSSEKNWPPDRFAQLTERITASRCEVVLPQGEADADAVRRVSAGLRTGGRIVSMSLVETAALILGAAFYVGNDSGLTHVAAALGVHTVAVFGPTDPVLWRPAGPRVHVVRGADGRFPDLAQVLDAIRLDRQ